jgi:4'-phosphopantetheinyl transferase
MNSIMEQVINWDWRYPTEPISLKADEVHVWQAPLKLKQTETNYFYSILSPEERVRAARLRDTRLQDRFVAARGWLRHILWQYIHIKPGDIQFSYNEHGKPALVHPFDITDGQRVEFNLSHSGDLAMYAICRQRTVGIDVEWIDEHLEMDVIAGRFFSPAELHVFETSPEKQKANIFYACWTQKEAYLKARGEGFCHPTNAFSILPGRQAALKHSLEPAENHRWSLLQWNPDQGAHAALAVEGKADIQPVYRTIQ